MTMTRQTSTLLLLSLSLPLWLAGCALSENGPETSPPDLTPPPQRGILRIGSASVMSGPDTYEQSMALALFYDPNAASPVCTRSETRNCVTHRCGAIKNVPSAGDITIKGGSEDVLLRPGTSGAYTEYRNTSTLTFQRGQILNLSASGKDVPAWQTPLTIPTQVFSLQSPSPARIDLTWVLHKTQDLALTWTPTTPGHSVRIELSQDFGQSQGTLIECVFDGSQGAGSVPASVIAQLQTTVGINHAVGVLVGPGSEIRLSPPGWDVSVWTIGVGRTGIATIAD